MNAIVTGASRGIGEAVAREFSHNGYHVALISRDIERSGQAAERIGKNTIPYKCDIRYSFEVYEVFHDFFSREGSIDVLVNNAGVNSRISLRTDNPENWNDNSLAVFSGWAEEIDTNLTGSYVCSYIAAGYMLKNRRGSIINISSIKGKESTSSPGYGASKAGIIKITKDLSSVLAGSGIRVNCIAPGFIDTGMTSELPEDKKAKYMQKIPQKRFGSVEEIAKAALFLAGPDSSYITGATIDVNGGYL